MAMISPAYESFNESLSTLKFANRAKNIKNTATVNVDMNEKALLRRYEKELKRLRHELERKNKNVVDKRKLLEVEEQRKRAERDKMAAMLDLEKMSKDLMREKAVKKKLEQKIRTMTSQLLAGRGVSAGALKSTAEFRSAIQKEQQRIRQEYQNRLSHLEQERSTVENDKAEVDRYKQLLVKQRDIMIQLTARLNERDQSILALQDELDAYDLQQRKMEEMLDQKTFLVIQLQKLAMESEIDISHLPAIKIPDKHNTPDHENHDGDSQPQEVGALYDDLSIHTPSRPITPRLASGAATPLSATVHAAARMAPFRRPNSRANDDCDDLSKTLERVRQEKRELHCIVREKENESERWKQKYERNEQKLRNAEYMLKLTKVGGSTKELQEQLNTILRCERQIAESKFNKEVSKLKVLLTAKDEEIVGLRADAKASKPQTQTSKSKVLTKSASNPSKPKPRVKITTSAPISNDPTPPAETTTTLDTTDAQPPHVTLSKFKLCSKSKTNSTSKVDELIRKRRKALAASQSEL